MKVLVFSFISILKYKKNDNNTIQPIKLKLDQKWNELFPFCYIWKKGSLFRLSVFLVEFRTFGISDWVPNPENTVWFFIAETKH